MRLEFHNQVASDITRVIDYYSRSQGQSLQ